jgi:hypothetical protein
MMNVFDSGRLPWPLMMVFFFRHLMAIQAGILCLETACVKVSGKTGQGGGKVNICCVLLKDKIFANHLESRISSDQLLIISTRKQIIKNPGILASQTLLSSRKQTKHIPFLYEQD